MIVDADVSLNAVADSFIEKLLSRGSDVVLQSELEWKRWYSKVFRGSSGVVYAPRCKASTWTCFS